MKRVMITAAAFFLLAPLGLLFVSSNTPRLAVSSSNGTDFEKKEVGDATHEEAEWWLLGWRGEDGELPAGNPLPEVIAQREEFLASQVDSQGFGSDGTARLHWVPRGPQNVGGRTRALVIHPIDPNIMWAASASGGIWKTSDGGANWFAGNGPIGNLGILSLAIHPADPDILYAGTGEEFPGGGIFKSEDGGDTWSAFPLNDTAGWGHISRISVAYIPGSPTPTTHLLVATDGAGINTQGIRRSTDGGTTWTREVSDALDARFVSFDPTSSTNAVGEVLFQCPNPPCHALHRAVFSTDGGDTWDTSTISDGDNPAEDFINNPNGRVEFAYSASETNTVYALYKPNGSNGARLAKSENGGEDYVIINTLSAPEVGDYTNTLWVSPSDPDLIVIGGGALYRSINGGATFTLIMAGNFITEFGHWDQQFMVSPPNFANNFERLYICNDGGIFVTDDIRTAELYSTSDWRSLNHTYQTTQYDGVDGSAASGLIIGGSRDNTLLRLRANETLSDIILGPGDGGFAAVDPSNSSYCYGGGGGYHTGPGEGVLFRSANCSANSISPPDIPSTQLFPPDQVLGYAPFLAAFVLDPNNPERLIYGGSSLWRTNNARAAVSPSPSVQTWTEIKVNPEITPLPSATSTPYKPIRISAVAVAPSNSDIIWVAEYDLLTPNPTSDPLGRLYKTSNGTQSAPSWTTVDDNTSGHNPLEANRYITRIVIDPDDAQVVYVALGGFGSQSGYNVDNLYKTTDGGGEWSSISGPDHEAGGLPRVPIRGFARHPNDPDKLYAGTEIGIYTSDDGGGTWSPVVDGPVNVPIAELKFMTINPNASPQPTPSTVLIAATHGRGLWVTDVDLVGNGNIAPNDFDGDGRSDIAVVRPAAPSPSPPTSSTWYMRRSSQGYTTFPYGLNDDQIVPADFNGDGKTDIAVWRPTDRYFIWMDDTTPVYFQWGLTGDIAVPADYDGDGEADYAVFRPSTGYWYVKRSSNGSTLAMQFGQDGDVPTPADFDGDGQTDICVARLDDMEHIWYLHYTNEMMLDAYIQFGLDGDIPVVGNYDNDDVADVAVWRPDDGSGSGYWYITHGITGWVDLESIQWGRTNDVPVPGDYDGDGRLDIAVWRPTQTIGGVPVEGMWYIRQSTLGYKSLKFGSDGDTPVPHKTDTGIGRPANDGDKRVPPSARPQRGAGPSHNVK